MKRQRGASVNGVNNPKNLPNVEDVVAMGKKKGKQEGEQKMEKEERKENRDISEGTTTIREGVNWNWEEYMPWLGGVVDEQMSWGSTWFPGWDMDFMGEAFNNALYNDVVWDDDIWNLKNQIPIPLHGKRFELE